MGKQQRRRLADRQREKRKTLTWLTVGVLGVAGLVVIVALAKSSQSNLSAEDRFHFSNSPVYASSAGANVTVVAFEAPDCPSCRIFHNGYGDGQPSTFERLVTDYFASGRVRYVEKTFYIHEAPWEERGAAAQKCVWHDRPALFFNLTQAFYRIQDRITDANFNDFLTQWAKSENYDGAKLQSCVASNPYSGDITQDLADGERAGVRGTPTYFILGKDGSMQRIVGPQPYDTFVQAIRNAGA